MRIKYWWYKSEEWHDGVLRPACACVKMEVELKGLIFNFLNDDEGLGLKYLSTWIDEGVIEVEKIKNNTLDFYNMWGQAWGAEITKENVLIYWGYDNTQYEEKIGFECFYKILKKWSLFLKTEPGLDNMIEFEC